MEGGSVRQAGDAAGLPRGQQQAEAGNGDRIGIEVHAVDGVEGPLHEFATGRGWFSAAPVVQQSPERPQQEVPAAASRVDEPDLLQTKFRDGRLQGAFKDEFLDEDGGLQQGIFLAGRLGQVLVEVAQKTAVDSTESVKSWTRSPLPA